MVFQRNKRIENMREIVFRGKRADTGEWVYGDLIHVGYLYCVGNDIEAFTKAGFNECVVNPDTVGQYTGLKDIEGERIWEGDIVRYNCSDKVIVGKVVWCTCFFEVDVRNGAESYALTSFCRVIGNIHDNPELLEGEGS